MTIPEQYDYSNGSRNTYLIEARHRLVNPCMHCKVFTPILLDGSDYWAFFVVGVKKVQEVFPYLTADQRDHLLNGIHPECYDIMFGKDPIHIEDHYNGDDV
jgi:hypothetical protein